MNKIEFLQKLELALDRLPENERNKTLLYYSEMIEDRIEDGKSEEEAVGEMEAIGIIAQRIIDETPIHKFVSEKIKTTAYKSSNKTLMAILLILSSIIWVPLASAALIVFFSFVFTIGMFVLTAYLLVVTFGASAIILVLGIPYMFISKPYLAILALGFAFICIGCAILSFRLAVALSKGFTKLALVFARWIKGLFVKKEEA